MTQEGEHYLKNELYQLLAKDTSVFQFLEEVSLDGLWYWDLESPENEWMSSRFWELLGYDPVDKKHKSSEWQALIHPEDLKEATQNFEAHCKDHNHPYDQVVRYRHKNGSTVWVRCRGVCIRDASGIPIRMLGAHNDITELKNTQLELEKQNKELEKLAKYDCLTSLLNRSFFQEHFSKQLQIAVRQETSLSLLMIDIDHFKRVNDRYGHLQGDEALKSVASIIRETARASDIPARFGGEEFIVLLTNTNDVGSIEAGERFRNAIANHSKDNLSVTVSVGAATFLNGKNRECSTIDEQFNTLLGQADKALYYAKSNGRNQVCHFNMPNNETVVST